MLRKFAGFVAAAATGALAFGAPVGAHHAIGSAVDTTRQLVSTMTLTRVDYINPHAWLHFTMPQGNGKLVKDVPIEWLSLSGLRQIGFDSARDFDIGATYKVTYYPNRDGSLGGFLVRMVDAEGNVYQRRR